MKSRETITLSSLGKTWLFDLDGTIVKHNGYKIDGHDTFLPGAKEFLLNIPSTDKIVFLTSRTTEIAADTENFLRDAGVNFSHIVYDLPYGERILFNDRKPSGLKMAYAIDSERDEFATINFEIDENI